MKKISLFIVPLTIIALAALVLCYLTNPKIHRGNGTGLTTGFFSISTGTTSTGTSGSSAVQLFTGVTTNPPLREVQAINEGAVDCLISFDGGATYGVVPAGTARLFNNPLLSNSTIQIKRPGSTDVTGFFLDGHY